MAVVWSWVLFSFWHRRRALKSLDNRTVSRPLSWAHRTVSCLFDFSKNSWLTNFTSVNGHPTGALQHRTHHLTTHSQPGNLQKLLMNGNGVTSSTSGNINTISIPTITQHGTNGNRHLAPGGAELNLLPSSSTPNGAIYRNQGKLAIMKGEWKWHLTWTLKRICCFTDNNHSNRVHVMQSTPTIVVSQPQSINIIASSTQLAGKVMSKLIT